MFPLASTYEEIPVYDVNVNQNIEELERGEGRGERGEGRGERGEGRGERGEERGGIERRDRGERE